MSKLHKIPRNWTRFNFPFLVKFLFVKRCSWLRRPLHLLVLIFWFSNDTFFFNLERRFQYFQGSNKRLTWIYSCTVSDDHCGIWTNILCGLTNRDTVFVYGTLRYHTIPTLLRHSCPWPWLYLHPVLQGCLVREDKRLTLAVQAETVPRADETLGYHKGNSSPVKLGSNWYE